MSDQDQRTPFLLTSKDPSFSGLLEHLCQHSTLQMLTTAGPSITLEAVRTNAPAFVLLDLDSVDAVEATRLIIKLNLVSHCTVLLTGADAIPGSSGMDSFFSAGAHGCLLKPEGKTSLGLTGDAGKSYLAQLITLHSQLSARRSL